MKKTITQVVEELVAPTVSEKTPQARLYELQQEALRTKDFAALQAFYDTDEYKNLSYIERNRGFVSSHKLAEFMRCQFCYAQKYVYEIPDPTEDETSDALVIGQAFDDLLTEGREYFDNKYDVVDRRSAKAEKKQLTKGQMSLISNMAREFYLNPLFDAPKKKILLHPMNGLILKVELDDIDLKKRVIRDMKSCANITTFRPSYYLHQMAFYQIMVEMVLDETCEVMLEVCDKNPDFSRSQAVLYKAQTLQFARGKVVNALEELKLADETGLYMPAVDQDVLFECPYYGLNDHGRPTKPLEY